MNKEKLIKYLSELLKIHVYIDIAEILDKLENGEFE